MLIVERIEKGERPEEGCVTSLPAYLERVRFVFSSHLYLFRLLIWPYVRFTLTTPANFDYAHPSFDVAINKLNGNIFCH